MLELLYSKRSFVIQLFRFFRIESGHGFGKGKFYSFISLGIWKFDVSFAIEKDDNAHDIKKKWNS